MDLLPRQLSAADGVAIGAVLVLALLVRWFHTPWPATVALAGILMLLDHFDGRPAVPLLLHGLVYLALGGFLFWAMDRTVRLLPAVALALAGALVIAFLAR